LNVPVKLICGQAEIYRGDFIDRAWFCRLRKEVGVAWTGSDPASFGLVLDGYSIDSICNLLIFNPLEAIIFSKL